VRLAGKVAVVTGGGSGIGRTIAGHFGAEGMAVVVADVDAAAANETVAEISAGGGRSSGAVVDVTDPSGAEAMIRHAEAAFGGLDVLVNNAGGYDEPMFPDAPVEHWSRTLDLNLRAVMLGIHFALPALERRGGGAIVNVASSAGLGVGPYEGAPEYAAAKAAVIRLTGALGSLAERRVRVTCVCPHTVATPAVLAAIAELSDQGRELPQALRDVPLAPEEVADAVVELARDETLAGRVLLLAGGKRPRLLAPEERL
jgi:NAD(P)-dependent dehydrogenase (short-subunit alcohol dehydrogenase family)